MAKPVLYVDGKVLDMDAMSSITIERYNPLLSEGQQSYSYPFSIPRTGRNEQILHFPARFQRSGYEMQSSFACRLVWGHVQRVGKLLINGITRDSYDCSMTYDTAELLRGIGRKNLNELAWIPLDFTTKENLAEKIKDNFLGNNTSVLFNAAATFYLAIDYDKWTRKVLEFDEIIEVYSQLNDFGFTSLGCKHTGFAYVADNEKKELASPFGLAPFLRVDYVLRFIFEDLLNYHLDFGQRNYNPLEHICMLHNCADAVVDGILRQKQLVADCTVEDFVTSVENMFCGKFIFNAKTNTVKWVLWNDYLRGKHAPNEDGWIPRPNTMDGGAHKPYGVELLTYLEGYPEVSMQERRVIKLTMQRNMSSDGKPTMLKVITPDEYYSKKIKDEYKQNPSIHNALGKTDAARVGVLKQDGVTMCCNTFNYFDTIYDEAVEDISIAAEHLPTMEPSMYIAVKGDTVPIYSFGVSFFNSTPPLKSDGSESSDKKSTRPLAFAGFAYKTHQTKTYCVATTIGSPALGIQSLRLHLPEGLFNNYHYLRDKLLRQGVYNLTVTLDSSITIDENELYLFDGQPVMVESVLETLGAATQVVKLQTIKIIDDTEDGS
jgi:hypothetical protein